MMRQFLALVAILTGLTTLAAPAQARFSALDDVRVQVAGESAAQCQQVQAAAVVRTASPTDSGNSSVFCPRPGIVIAIPPVMLQADRARE